MSLNCKKNHNFVTARRLIPSIPCSSLWRTLSRKYAMDLEFEEPPWNIVTQKLFMDYCTPCGYFSVFLVVSSRVFFGGRFPFGKASFLISWNVHLRMALFFNLQYQNIIVFLESNISKKQGNLSRYIHFMFQKIFFQNTPSQPPEMSEAKSDNSSSLPFENMIMNCSFRIFLKNFPRKFACFLFSIRRNVFEFLVQQRNGYCIEALFAEFTDFTVLSVEEKFKIELIVR